MKKNSLLNAAILLLAVMIAYSCSSGTGGKSSGPIAGVEKYTKAFMEEQAKHVVDLADEDEEEDDWDWDDAFDQMKKDIEDHLTAAIGKTFNTNVSADVATVETPFTVKEASGNVGRSTAVPYVVIAAKLQSGNSSLGYICRDQNDVPVIAGKGKIKDGELEIVITFECSGRDEYCIAANKMRSSVTSVDLMDEKEFDSHVISCGGSGWGSSGKKGFGGILLRGKLKDIPDALPGIYDKKELSSYVIEGPEEDFEVAQATLSKGNKKVALVKEDEEAGIFSIDIYSPDLFVLASDTKGGKDLVNCVSDVAILLNASSSGRGVFDPDGELVEYVPVIKVGSAYFKGMKLKKEGPYNEGSFYYSDVVPETCADRVTIR